MMQFRYLILAVLELSFVYSLQLSGNLIKRAELPNLNEHPPSENITAEHPAHHEYGLGLIAPIKKPRSKLSHKKKTKLMKDIMRPKKECNHSESCPHWHDLSYSKKSFYRLLNWKMNLPKERKKELQRLASQRHRAGWTDEKRRKHYDLDNKKRKERYLNLTPAEKEAKKAFERERYYKNREHISAERKKKRVLDKKRKMKEAGSGSDS